MKLQLKLIHKPTSTKKQPLGENGHGSMSRGNSTVNLHDESMTM